MSSQSSPPPSKVFFRFANETATHGPFHEPRWRLVSAAFHRALGPKIGGPKRARHYHRPSTFTFVKGRTGAFEEQKAARTAAEPLAKHATVGYGELFYVRRHATQPRQPQPALGSESARRSRGSSSSSGSGSGSGSGSSSGSGSGSSSGSSSTRSGGQYDRARTTERNRPRKRPRERASRHNDTNRGENVKCGNDEGRHNRWRRHRASACISTPLTCCPELRGAATAGASQAT